MRSYKAADADDSGLIGRNEFRMLLKALVFYTDLWDKFEEIDVNGDHRLGLREFVTGCHLVGGASFANAESNHPRPLEAALRRSDSTVFQLTFACCGLTCLIQK